MSSDESGVAGLRVVVADDSPLMRRGVAAVLSGGGAVVVAEVTNPEDLLCAVDRLAPDMVVSDIRMPPGYSVEGLTAAVAIQRRFPAMGILLLSNYAETRHVATLLGHAEAGVGYLLKERVIETADFLDAVGRVGAGGTALDPEIVTLLLARKGQRTQIALLTRREQDVLASMATGASNAAIAAALYVSTKTVESHAQHIFAKLDLWEDRDENRRVKAVLAYLHGF